MCIRPMFVIKGNSPQSFKSKHHGNISVQKLSQQSCTYIVKYKKEWV